MARASARGTRIISPGSTGRTGPVSFLKETASELRKSVWPSREETSRLTVVVIILAVVAGFFLAGMDFIFDQTFTNYVLT